MLEFIDTPIVSLQIKSCQKMIQKYRTAQNLSIRVPPIAKTFEDLNHKIPQKGTKSR